jgi:hypothetical protein
MKVVLEDVQLLLVEHVELVVDDVAAAAQDVDGFFLNEEDST